MPKVSSNEQILSYVRDNNWLMLWASEGNIMNVFLTPGGNMVEIYFEKNKASIKILPDYVCK